jgi:hypothetical protein
MREGNRKMAAKIAKDKSKDALFDLTEVNDTVSIWTAQRKHNIFKYSSFKREYLFQFYCKATEDEFDKMKKTNKPQQYKGDPEAFQVVMAASYVLKHVFQEDCFKTRLMSDIRGKRDQYETVFGEPEEALKRAWMLEAHVGTLPVGAKIPLSDFRRVININIASIASFLAFAIYDERSFNFLSVLLMQQSGEAIPRCSVIFPDGLLPLEQVLEDQVQPKQYLFQHETLDDGADFVKHVIEVINRFGDFLSLDENRYKKLNRVFLKGRIEGLVFRTLASDLVEIYVSHGCYPLCSIFCKTRHPWLMDLLKHNRAKKPVPVLMEYIILAIENSKIKVATSHCYNSSLKLVSHVAPKAQDQGTSQDGAKLVSHVAPKGQDEERSQDGAERPLTRNIRYLYKLVDAKKGNGGDFDEWLMLTEVVNVILFNVKNPWNTDDDGTIERIDWLPNFNKSEKRVAMWVKPKEEKPGSKKKAKIVKETAAVKESAAVAAAKVGDASAEPGDMSLPDGGGGDKSPEAAAQAVTGTDEVTEEDAPQIFDEEGQNNLDAIALAASLVQQDPSVPAKEQWENIAKAAQEGGSTLNPEDQGRLVSSVFRARPISSPKEKGKGSSPQTKAGLKTTGLPEEEGNNELSLTQEEEMALSLAATGGGITNEGLEEAMSVEESVAENETPEYQFHATLLKISNYALQLINMGSNTKVHPEYPQILESIKNVSMTLTILVQLQQFLLQQHHSLAIPTYEDGTYDINHVLLELQKFIVEITQEEPGRPLVKFSYSEEGIAGHQNLIQKLRSYVGNLMPRMASMTGGPLGGKSTLSFNERRSCCEPIVIQEPSSDSREKICLWKEEIDESQSQQTQKQPAKETTPKNTRKKDTTKETTPTKKRKRETEEESESVEAASTRTTPKRATKKPQRYGDLSPV